MSRLIRGLLLLAMAGVIGKLLVTGQMVLYLSPALDPLSAVTGAVLAALGGHELWAAARPRTGARPSRHGSLTDDLLSYVVVLVPVGLGLLATPRALDPNALGDQDAARVVVAFSATHASSAAAPPLQPIRDVADLLAYLQMVGEAGVGQPVHVVGMVAPDHGLPADQFVLLRYSIVHCVADAQPLGVLIQMPDASGGTSITATSWVAIDGTLASTERGGAHLISIIASHVVATPEPPNPYVQIF